MNLNALLKDSQIKQKKGIHFIIASVIIWSLIFFIHSTSLSIDFKNLLTFFATAPLMPISYVIAKILNIDFTNKENPLTKLGLLFSLNQLLYLLIAMWVMNQQPESLVMVLAIIFGAHLLPYSWLYQSKTYQVFALVIPLAALIIGIIFEPMFVALFMIFVEILFVIVLRIEVKNIIQSST
jgi:hypothetical protein